MGENLEKKKMALKKFDPTLTAAAIGELMAAKKIEKTDVDAVKGKIKEIYKMLPETKDRAGIITQAIDEVNTEVVAGEIEKIKSELAGLKPEELMEINKDLMVDPTKLCVLHLITCGIFIACCDCIRYAICARCVRYAICSFCVSYRIICPGCITYMIGCGSHCISYGIPCGVAIGSGCGAAIQIDPGIPLEPDPLLKEKLVEAVIDDPRLTRAMKKLVAEMKKNKEI